MTVCISPRFSILSHLFYFWLQPILRRASLFWFLFAFFIVCLSYWGLSCSQITIVWLIFISVLSCDWQIWYWCHMFILLYTVIHTSVACFILLFSFKYCLFLKSFASGKSPPLATSAQGGQGNTTRTSCACLTGSGQLPKK